MDPLYPEITIRIPYYQESRLAPVMRGHLALRIAGHTEKADAFRNEALSGDGNHLVATVKKYFNIEVEDDGTEDEGEE